MKSSIFTIFFSVVGLLSSCTEEIKIDLGSSEPELVVEGAISTDTMAHAITLKKTGYYFSNQEAEGIRGAEVLLSDGLSEIMLTESAVKSGTYFTPDDYFGTAGRTYSLTIRNVDVNNDGVKETYVSDCALNAVPPIDSMTVEKKRVFFQDAYAIRISMQEPANVQNYYLFRVWKNDICVSDSINEWGITDDEFFKGKYLINESVMYLFPEEKPDEELIEGDRVKVEMCGISKDYLYFINEVVEEYRGRNPLFGGQPANIRTNIKRTFPESSDGKGARGFFAAYAVQWKETVYLSGE